MPLTRRNKISSQEDFFSLSMVKQSKPSKRPMEVADDSINVSKKQKRCKLRYNADREVHDIVATVEDTVDENIVDEEEATGHENVVDNIALQTSISEGFEFVGGDFELDFEEEDTVEENVRIPRKRGPNKLYVFVEEFENKVLFDEYWKEMEFSKIYYHHVSKTTDSGMEEIFCQNPTLTQLNSTQLKATLLNLG